MFELQIPEETAKLLKDNPQLAAKLLQDVNGYLDWLAVASIAVMVLVVYMAKNELITKDSVAKLFCATMVMIFASFLVIVGYSQSQLAFLTAFLGAILGHFFKDSNHAPPPPTGRPPHQPGY